MNEHLIITEDGLQLTFEYSEKGKGFHVISQDIEGEKLQIHFIKADEAALLATFIKAQLQKINNA